MNLENFKRFSKELERPYPPGIFCLKPWSENFTECKIRKPACKESEAWKYEWSDGPLMSQGQTSSTWIITGVLSRDKSIRIMLNTYKHEYFV